MALADDSKKKSFKIKIPTYLVYRLGFFLYVCFKVRIMIIWGLFDSLFSTVVSFFFLLAVVATIVVIVMDNRNPFKTLAWVLVLQVSLFNG